MCHLSSRCIKCAAAIPIACIALCLLFYKVMTNLGTSINNKLEQRLTTWKANFEATVQTKLLEASVGRSGEFSFLTTPNYSFNVLLSDIEVEAEKLKAELTSHVEAGTEVWDEVKFLEFGQSITTLQSKVDEFHIPTSSSEWSTKAVEKKKNIHKICNYIEETLKFVPIRPYQVGVVKSGSLDDEMDTPQKEHEQAVITQQPTVSSTSMDTDQSDENVEDEYEHQSTKFIPLVTMEGSNLTLGTQKSFLLSTGDVRVVSLIDNIFLEIVSSKLGSWKKWPSKAELRIRPPQANTGQTGGSNYETVYLELLCTKKKSLVNSGQVIPKETIEFYIDLLLRLSTVAIHFMTKKGVKPKRPKYPPSKHLEKIEQNDENSIPFILSHSNLSSSSSYAVLEIIEEPKLDVKTDNIIYNESQFLKPTKFENVSSTHCTSYRNLIQVLQSTVHFDPQTEADMALRSMTIAIDTYETTMKAQVSQNLFSNHQFGQLDHKIRSIILQSFLLSNEETAIVPKCGAQTETAGYPQFSFVWLNRWSELAPEFDKQAEKWRQANWGHVNGSEKIRRGAKTNYLQWLQSSLIKKDGSPQPYDKKMVRKAHDEKVQEIIDKLNSNLPPNLTSILHAECQAEMELWIQEHGIKLCDHGNETGPTFSLAQQDEDKGHSHVGVVGGLDGHLEDVGNIKMDLNGQNLEKMLRQAITRLDLVRKSLSVPKMVLDRNLEEAQSSLEGMVPETMNNCLKKLTNWEEKLKKN